MTTIFMCKEKRIKEATCYVCVSYNSEHFKIYYMIKNTDYNHHGCKFSLHVHKTISLHGW